MGLTYQVNRPKHTVAHLQKAVGGHREALALISDKYGPASPYGKWFYPTVKKIHNMNVLDQIEFRKMIHMFGWDKRKTVEQGGIKFIGWMPAGWFGAVTQTNPDFDKDEVEFHKMLKAYPEFSVPEAMQ